MVIRLLLQILLVQGLERLICIRIIRGKKGSWATTGDDIYWPLDENMEFFAYPTELKANFQAPGTGYPTFTYAIGAVGAQTDLVVAHKKVWHLCLQVAN